MSESAIPVHKKNFQETLNQIDNSRVRVLDDYFLHTETIDPDCPLWMDGGVEDIGLDPEEVLSEFLNNNLKELGFGERCHQLLQGDRGLKRNLINRTLDYLETNGCGCGGGDANERLSTIHYTDMLMAEFDLKPPKMINCNFRACNYRWPLELQYGRYQSTREFGYRNDDYSMDNNTEYCF